MPTTLDSPDFYTIGWIAALPIERAAATDEAVPKHKKTVFLGFITRPISVDQDWMTSKLAYIIESPTGTSLGATASSTVESSASR